MRMMCQDESLESPTVQSAIAEEPQNESGTGRDHVRPGLLKSHGHAIASFPRNESGASADEQLRESGTLCGVAGGTRRGERTPLNMWIIRFYGRGESSVVARERQIDTTQRPMTARALQC
jgi:hypothetical protein